MLQIGATFIKNDKGEIEEIPPNPYLWLTLDRSDIFFQDGKFYTGTETLPLDYEDVPEWFWEIIRTSYLISEAGINTIKKLNLILPENRVKTKEEKDSIKASATWVCEEDGCGQTILNSLKGPHIARHANIRKKKEREARKLENNECQILDLVQT